MGLNNIEIKCINEDVSSERMHESDFLTYVGDLIVVIWCELAFNLL